VLFLVVHKFEGILHRFADWLGRSSPKWMCRAGCQTLLSWTQL